ncbi:MAG: protein-disulfide reductase DsbD domain-containing protein, partial [Caldimonas sp.]
MSSLRSTRAWRALLLAVATATHGVVALAADAAYLEPDQAFAGSARVLDAATLELRFEVAPDYHLYRDRISVEVEDAGARLG